MSNAIEQLNALAGEFAAESERQTDRVERAYIRSTADLLLIAAAHLHMGKPQEAVSVLQDLKSSFESEAVRFEKSSRSFSLLFMKNAARQYAEQGSAIRQKADKTGAILDALSKK